tara:strand:+ start:1872 stop:2318 length:447 start_codon:yes stop_codon:yes gene_type:complete
MLSADALKAYYGIPFSEIENYCSVSINTRFADYETRDFRSVRVEMTMPIMIRFALPASKYDLTMEAVDHAQTMSKTLSTKTGLFYQCATTARVDYVASYGSVLVISYRLLASRPAAATVNFKQAALVFFLVLFAFFAGMLFREIQNTL